MAKFTLVTEPADIALLMSTFEPRQEGTSSEHSRVAPVSLVTTIWENEIRLEIWGFDTTPTADDIKEISSRRSVLNMAVHGRVNRYDLNTLASSITARKQIEDHIIERETRREFFVTAPRR